jgi:membrane protease YdiL (CAAX protease family)
MIVVTWGIRNAALGTGVLVAAILLGIAVLLAVRLLSDATGAPAWAVLLSTLVFQVVLASAAYGLGPGRRYGLRPLFGPRRLSSRALFGWGTAAFFGSVGATAVYVAVVVQISPSLVPPPLPVDLEELVGLTFLLVVLVGPIVEEMFFRGFLFGALAQRLGFWAAATASAALFGVAHLDPLLAGPAFLSGVVFAWVYWRTGSLWPTVLAHTSQNAIAFGLAAG